jgi:hypothetical protein
MVIQDTKTCSGSIDTQLVKKIRFGYKDRKFTLFCHSSPNLMAYVWQMANIL